MNSQVASTLVVERTYRASVEDLWDLWTTKEGFESWWGPEGFRAEVHVIEPRQDGALHYNMVADTPQMVKTWRRWASRHPPLAAVDSRNSGLTSGLP